MSPVEEDRPVRVKLYLLSSASDWEDLGTGYLHLSGPQLTITDEEAATVLLDYVVKDEVFWRQGETILLFSSPQGKTFAVSFQEKIAAVNALQHICAQQNRDIDDIVVEDDASSDCEEVIDIGLDSLPQLAERLSKLRLSGKSAIAQVTFPTSFLDELGALFQKAEAETSEYLSVFFDIYKELIHSGNEQLLKSLLSDQHYKELFGALEYPELRDKKPGFREFLKNVKFCNVLGIDDKEFLVMITRNYRLQYLKDTAFARCVDEACAGFLICAQVNIWSEVLDCFLQSKALRKKFMERLKSLDLDCFELLNEMGAMAKNVVPYLRMEFYEFLYAEGILKLAAQVFEEEEYSESSTKMHVYLSEILICLLTASPARARDFLFSSPSSTHTLLSLISHSLLHSTEISSLQTLSDLLKTVLEPAPEKRQGELFTAFYDTVVPQLVESLYVEGTIEEDQRARLCEVLGLLTLCVQSHGYRVRCLVSNHDLVKVGLRLIALGDKTVIVAVLKLLKAILQRGDNSLTALIAAENALEAVWRIFAENEPRENLLFSLCLGVLQSVTQVESVELDEAVATSVVIASTPGIQRYFREIVARQERRKEENGRLEDWTPQNLKRRREEEDKSGQKKAKVEMDGQ